MIPLREDSNMTVGEFMSTLTDIYHDYFPKSYFECFIRDIEGLGCFIVVGLHLLEKNAESQEWDDPIENYRNRFSIFPTEVRKNLYPDSVMSPEVRLEIDDSGYYDFGVISWLNDDGIPDSEDVPVNLGNSRSRSYTLEEVLEWFEGFCKRLHKTLYKLIRRKRLSSEWEEYL